MKITPEKRNTGTANALNTAEKKKRKKQRKKSQINNQTDEKQFFLQFLQAVSAIKTCIYPST